MKVGEIEDERENQLQTVKAALNGNLVAWGILHFFFVRCVIYMVCVNDIQVVMSSVCTLQVL